MLVVRVEQKILQAVISSKRNQGWLHQMHLLSKAEKLGNIAPVKAVNSPYLLDIYRVANAWVVIAVGL